MAPSVCLFLAEAKKKLHIQIKLATLEISALHNQPHEFSQEAEVNSVLFKHPCAGETYVLVFAAEVLGNWGEGTKKPFLLELNLVTVL